MADLRVSLPSPCNEPWEGMVQQGCNRHCSACDKTIHDLSFLTIDQAEALLDSADEVCVRARVGQDGVVDLASHHGAAHRRMIAAVGVSITLATAACQTTPVEERPNRFEISGTIPWSHNPTKPVIRSSDGRTWRVEQEWRSTSFRVPDLFPGVYSITFAGGCGAERVVIEGIEIRDASIDLGQLEGTEDCIIVGVMTRSDSRFEG